MPELRRIVRPEEAADKHAVHRVTTRAFGRLDEADLVDRLRTSSPSYLAFVAENDGEVIGHIAFTTITLDPARPELSLVGLAPMSVAPGCQRSGIGSALVTAGLEACRLAGHDAVFVLGHPDYYPRFGFQPVRGIANVYGAPPEAFMVLELEPGALDGIAGMAHYAPAFAE